MAIIIPHVVEKLEKLGDQQALNLVRLLQEEVEKASPTRSGAWEKKLQQAQISGRLERMNISALMDLVTECLPEHVNQAYIALQRSRFPFPKLLPEGAVITFWL